MCVFVDGGECLRESFYFGTGIVAVPLQVGSLPVNHPNILRPEVANFGNRFLDPVARNLKGGTIQEQFNRLPGDSLAFAQLIAKFERWTVVRPELVFQLAEDCCGFVFGKGHETVNEIRLCCYDKSIAISGVTPVTLPMPLLWIIPGNESALACRDQGQGDHLMKLATSRQLRGSITSVNLHIRQAVFCKHLSY